MNTRWQSELVASVSLGLSEHVVAEGAWCSAGVSSRADVQQMLALGLDEHTVAEGTCGRCSADVSSRTGVQQMLALGQVFIPLGQVSSRY